MLVQAILLSALSAVLLTLASPPYDVGWLAWAAPVPLFYALLGVHAGTENPRGIPFWSGFTFGFLYLMLLASWFAGFSPAGYPCAGVYWGLLAGGVFTLVVRLTRGAGVLGTAPLLAAGWTVLEWLRCQGTLTFPWGSLASTQHRYLPVIQVLDLCGAFGLSFLMALLAAGAAAMLRPAHRRGGHIWAGIALLLVALSLARGASILASPAVDGDTARVAVVQQSRSEKPDGVAVVCISPPEKYAAATIEAVRLGAELVVWPESTVQGDPVNDPGTRVRLAGLLSGSTAHVLVGGMLGDRPTGRYRNGAAMVSTRGELIGSYSKVLIVPFGEYLPARPLLRWTEALGMPSEDLLPGNNWAPVPWSRGTVGISICYESAFGAVSRSTVNQGANLLAVLTSDGWAGRRAAGLQHATFAPLRAVENRRSVARAAATGVSQLLDPCGRRLRSIPMFHEGVALAELPLRRDLTLYTRLGDWPVALSWAILLAALAPELRRFRKRYSAEPLQQP